MRVGYDLSALGPFPTGVGRYAACLLEALLADSAVTAVHGFSPGAPPAVALPTSPKLVVHAGREARRLPWLYLTLPIQSAGIPVDVFHFPNYLAPRRLHAPAVVTVHDLTVFDFPSVHPLRRRLAHHLLLHRSLQGAAVIIAVSESTRRALADRWPAFAPKIRIVPEAAAATMARVTDPSRLSAVREKYALPGAFILSPGATDPRKNLPRLARAMAAVRRDTGLPHEVVTTCARPKPPKRADGVLNIGYVPDTDLPALYSLAALTAYPSLHEGFGLPPLESFACGIPVIASTAGAIPEVCGDAALLVDPLDETALAGALRRVLTEPATAADLVARGTARAAGFTWSRAASLTVEAYRAAMGE